LVREPEPAEPRDGDLTLELEPLSLDLTPPPPGVAGWDEVAHFLSGFLLTRSATRSAALVADLLAGRAVDLERMPDSAKQALGEAGIAEKRGRGFVPTSEFRQQVNDFQQDFMNGRADPDTLLPWLSTLTRALLANGITAAAVRVHLEQSGIERLLKRAA
jgi:hypothetical protein